VPKANLDVYGDIGISGVLTHHSDRRYKREITPITSHLNNLLKIQGVEYKKSGEAFREMLADLKIKHKETTTPEEFQEKVNDFE